MNRESVIKSILAFEDVSKNDIIVSSVGMTSRELYNVKDRKLNLYLMGGMGNALSIAHGISLYTNRKVIAILGDGEFLMGYNSLVFVTKMKPKNLRMYVLNNNEYASTGGQKTISDALNYNSLFKWVTFLNVSKGKGNAPRIPLTGKQIKERFLEALND